MATHSSTLAWQIPWTEEPGRLQSMGSLGVGHDWATLLSLFTFIFHFHALEKEMATHSSVLAWRVPGTGEPGGLPSVGSPRVGHDWSDLAAAAAAAWCERSGGSHEDCLVHMMIPIIPNVSNVITLLEQINTFTRTCSYISPSLSKIHQKQASKINNTPSLSYFR